MDKQQIKSYPVKFDDSDIRLSIARVECNLRRGTGFILSNEGHVLTSAHLIDNVRNTKVYFFSIGNGFGLEFRVIELYYSEAENGDFCLLKLQEKLPDHLKPLRLINPSSSKGNHFFCYGFPDSKPKEGIEGKGIIEHINLISELNPALPVIQLGESNSISYGFSGSPIIDRKNQGVIGIINEGVIDAKSFRELGTSLGIPIDFIAEHCKTVYSFPVIELKSHVRLPSGFSYLGSAVSERVTSAKIKYQDFLQSDNLPYISRAEFRSKNSDSGAFVTESFIVEELLKGDGYEGGIIFGEGGIGKTRLMLEIGQYAQANGWIVIRAYPDATSVEDLLPYMSSQNKYLLLFDYIEESKCFDSDVFNRFCQENKHLTVRILANCRYTYKLSSNFPETFLQIELERNEIETKYQIHVTQIIIHEIIQKFSSKNVDFYSIKPSFAVFLKFLLCKDKLENKDIRDVNDFKTWIKKRFRLTLNVENFSDLDKKVIYLLSILPLANDDIDLVYKSGFESIIQRLKNDGWIEEVEVNKSSVLKAIHDTIVDEILIIHLDYLKKDIKRELANLFEFSIQYRSQISWLRSMERIVEQSILSNKQHSHEVLHEYINKNPESVGPLKYLLGVTQLLDESHRIKLIALNPDFFKDYIENPLFSKPLSFALNKERLNKDIECYFRQIFAMWYLKNRLFHQNFNVSYRILSTYIKYFGLDDFVAQKIEWYLRLHLYKRETSFVLQAWLANHCNLSTAGEYVRRYLQKNGEDSNASFVLTGWLDNDGELETVRQHVVRYLDKNCEESRAEFVLSSWLKRNGDANIIRSHFKRYLQTRSENVRTSFILDTWFKNGGDAENLQQHVIRFLEKHFEHANAQFVLTGWLGSNGPLNIVANYVEKYLQKNCGSPNTTFLLKAWLDRQGDLDLIRPYLVCHLNENKEDVNAQFVLSSWLNNHGDLATIQEYVVKYLDKHSEDASSQFVLTNWLNNNGNIETIKAYVVRYLKNNSQSLNASFVLQAWFNNHGDITAVQNHVIDHLSKNSEDLNASFVLQAWFASGGNLDTVQQHVINYLSKNCEDPNAGFVLKAWFDNDGDLCSVEQYVNRYLEKNSEDSRSQFVLTGWLNNQGDLCAIQEYVFRYLRNNFDDRNAQFILAGWLNNKGSTAAVANYLNKYLEQYNEDLNTRFVLTGWLSNNGDITAIRKYVVKYLKRNCEDVNSSFVLQAWFENQGDLESIKVFVIRYLEKYAHLKNSAYHLYNWVRGRGPISEIKKYIVCYLETNAAFEEASYTLNILSMQGNFSIKPFQEYFIRFIESNIDKASYPLYNLLKRISDVSLVEDLVTKFLHAKVQDIDSQRILATWLNRSGNLNVVRDFLIRFLKIHSGEYESQFAISAWLKNGGEKEIIEPFLESYFLKNSSRENSGYVFISWLGVGGDHELVLDHLRMWLSTKQPDDIARLVISRMFQSGLIKELPGNFPQSGLS